MTGEALLPLADFGALQARYQPLALTARATALLADAGQVLGAAEHILAAMATHHNLSKAFATLHKNSMLMGKMRPSEAKTLLMDGGENFVAGTRHKLAAWKKTVERVSSGEDVAGNRIAASAPLAVAIIGSAGISHYLSIVQLALGELAKLDADNAETHRSHIAAIRRCATLLGDYESAAALASFIR